jgi:hypothetical protein
MLVSESLQGTFIGHAARDFSGRTKKHLEALFTGSLNFIFYFAML